MTNEEKEISIKTYSKLPLNYLNDLRNDKLTQIKELQDRLEVIEEGISKKKVQVI